MHEIVAVRGVSGRRGRGRWRSLPLGLKVGLVVAAVALLLPLIGSRWAANEAKRTVEQEALDGQKAAIGAMLGRLDVAYDNAVQRATAGADDPELAAAVTTSDATSVARLLRNLRQVGPYRHLAVYDAEGELVAADTDGAEPQTAEAIPAEPAISAPMAGPEGVQVVVRSPITDGEVPVGQLVAEIAFPELVGGPEGLRLPGGVDVAIVDPEGVILASRLGAQVEGSKVTSPEAQAMIRDGHDAVASYHAPRVGYDVIATYVVAEGRPWNAFASSKRDTVLAEANQLDRRLLTGGALLALLSLTAAVFVGFYVTAAERRLRRAREELAAVFESSDDAIMLLDPDGTVLSWNPAAETIYGYSAEEMVGTNAASVLAQPGQDAERSAAVERLANGLHAPAEVACVRKDGSEIVVAVTRSPILDRDGDLVAVSSISRDITDRKAATDALVDANVDLARSNADLEDFAAVAAHDLKTPLVTIGGFAEMLDMGLGGELNEDGRKYAAYVVKGVRRMQDLIDDLLTYSRVGTTAQRHRVALTDVVADTLDALAGPIGESGAQVVVEDLPVVAGDESQLRQLFQNLVANAIKFRRPDTASVITIAGRLEGRRVRVTVADNGIGIAPKDREQAFKMFQRLHSTDHPGTGIGLAICRRVVENHGGTIRVDSAADSGAVFHFDLPAASGATASA